MRMLQVIGGRGFGYISEYMDWLAHKPDYPNYFRGHADNRWTLVPGSYRENVIGITKRADLGRWKQAALRFLDRVPANELEWLVLAQHHGIATPLLDWTSNPLIALFFAAEETPEQTDGEIVALAGVNFEHPTTAKDRNPFAKRSKPALIDASGMNPRSMVQDSFMSIHTRAVPNMDHVSGDLLRYPIKHSEKKQVTQSLGRLGISEERVYADLARVVTKVKKTLATDRRIESLLK